MENTLFTYFKDAQKNNIESIEFIINKFNPLILKYARKLNNIDDGQSELTLQLLNTINKIPLEKEIFKNEQYIVSYVHTSIKNRFYHLYSKEKKYTTKENLFLNINDYIAFNKSNIIFYDLIKNLKPKEQFVLEKKFIYNYTNTEIANTLNVSRQNIQACINRSLNKLHDTAIDP